MSDVKACTNCGRQFQRASTTGPSAWSRAKYCSRACFGAARATHGHTRGLGITSTYQAWVNMRTRCENPKSTQYSWYGGRGVEVCERWKSYENFLADMGERPSPKHSLDRYPNVNGNYEPNNARWATRIEQGRNRRSNRAVIRADGMRFASLAEAAEAVNGTTCGVWDVCAGKTKTHRGYAWSYA